MGVPQIIQVIRLIRPWLSIETNGDLVTHHFKSSPYKKHKMDGTMEWGCFQNMNGGKDFFRMFMTFNLPDF